MSHGKTATGSLGQKRPVFLLHDADPAGCRMKRDLEIDPSWTALRRRVVDLGFFPEDFTKLKRTRNVRVKTGTDALPADIILLGSLATGLGACFVSQSSFADELLREHGNSVNASGVPLVSEGITNVREADPAYVKRILAPRRITAAGIFDSKRMQQLIRYDAEEGASRFGIRLWMLMTFEIWRRIVVEREPL